MTNNNQVNWDEIPEDVEAVVLHGGDTICYKVVDDIILSKPIESTKYGRSLWKDFDSIKDLWGDSFITRPPATQSPEFNWVDVERDVEAVVLSKTGDQLYHYKHIGGILYFAIPTWEEYKKSASDSLGMIKLRLSEGNKLLLRPPAITSTEGSISCKIEFSEGELPEGMIPLDEETKPPSISTILQEAQQSILKHHGVTGKVKFTVSVGE